MQAVILAGDFTINQKNTASNASQSQTVFFRECVIKWFITYLKMQGYDNIVFVAEHATNNIADYFISKQPTIQLKYVNTNTPLGSGGALFNIWDELENEFTVFNSNVFFDADIHLADNLFQNDNVDALVVLRYCRDLKKYGTVLINNEYQICSFVGKSQSDAFDGYINTGIYRIKKAALKPYKDIWHDNFISIQEDIFPLLISNNTLYGLPLGGLFIDTKVATDCERGKKLIPERLAQEAIPALFIDRDNTLIYDKGYTVGDNLTILDIADEYIKKANLNAHYVIVVSNQSGVARGYFNCNDVEYTNEHVRMAYLEKSLIIDDFLYCPYHINGSIKKFSHESLMRKPEPGMILSACEKYKIDLSRSIMIGDNPDVDTIKLPYIKSVILNN